MEHRTAEELTAAESHIVGAPPDTGTLELIVQRPDNEQRSVPDRAELDATVGLVGDNWAVRGSKSTADGTAHPGRQLTIMNARAVEAIAGDRDRWPLAGDQLYVDFDLSHDSLPAGSRLQIGAAVVEITAEPHLGCAKFTQRYGLDAMRWVNSDRGKELRLRGANARVVEGGVIAVGDPVTRC
jgi:hypothetical protein